MLANIGVTATAGVLVAAIFALGEEIGWRGFLVPELAKIRSFTGVALLSGAIWALFHFPFVFIFGAERAGTPIPYQLLVMTIQAIAIGTVVAWLRLKSGSLWTAVIFHAVLNVFGQGLFTNLTVNTELTPYIAGEQGLALAISWSIVAFLFWLKRDSLPQFQPQDDPQDLEAADQEKVPSSV
jgi:membrane protease YdiL (CAAX protease family)